MTPATPAPAVHRPPRAVSLADLQQRVHDGQYGPAPHTLRASVAFTTSQAVHHTGRRGGYRNEVLSLRVGAAVGSCAVEPGTLPARTAEQCAGADVATLLRHPVLPIRIAALDAYLMHTAPHSTTHGASPWPLPAGDSLRKSRARARAVADLLRAAPGERVLVIGVVNSLLEALRERGNHCIPCDLKGGTTEWGETIRTDAHAELGRCDAVLASGMTLANGTFEPLRAHAARTGTRLVMFAQTGSAILPRLLGSGVDAVCAEPYPFFWLDGGPGVVHRYLHRPGGAR
ncbi:Rossmann-like domain-containing protein [Streptomyces gamaensis]|uniref:Rossmann-like domain-containing protein n=1 Tax=Streptomyces gamaensis TaxID=1763542 RepID=A0ABW0YXF6_9ACTN